MKKRLFDIILTTILLVILAPSLLLITIVIKLESPGPALISQTRLGRKGLPFKLWKFRTMIKNAEQSHTEPNLELSKDQRITPIGLFLRKTSMDELPQLLNVLSGEMSLVGPYPALPLEANHYSERDLKRLELKPGVTGYWQAFNQKVEAGFTRMIEMDLEYADKQSFLFDLKILLRTIVMGFKGEAGR